MSDEEFEQASSGASHTYPCQAGSLKKGGHVLIKDKPCKIIEITTSKTGKHGHAKANIMAVDIFTGKKYEDVCPTSHNLPVPNVTRNEYQVLDIDNQGYVHLLLDDGTEKDDVKLPNETEEDKVLKEKLVQAHKDGVDLSVVLLCAMGIEKIVDMKEI
ncbi:hypothetical protein ABK040_014712 [Willaertia magna]